MAGPNDQGIDAYACTNCGHLDLYASASYPVNDPSKANPIFIRSTACAACGEVGKKEGPFSTVLPFYRQLS